MSPVETVPATVTEALQWAAQRLAAGGISNHRFESKQMVARCLGVSPARVDLNRTNPWDPQADALLNAFVAQRERRVPLAYLLGEWDFLEMTLTVSPDVLIPRPETEELFTLAAVSMGENVGSAADVGTGAGGLALASARRWPQAKVVAVDVSSAALAVARWNAQRLGLASRVRFVHGDLIQGQSDFDLVLANLPYVASSEMETLSPEVGWEPRSALLGGFDGLDLVRRCVPLAYRALRPGGKLWLEVGVGQGETTRGLLDQAGFREVTLRADFAGIERFVGGTR